MNHVREQLMRDHGELEELLTRLADDSSAPEPLALRDSWCELETRLLAHMDAEERHLLPLVEVSHPSESARTRAEHARIRQLVSELGLAVELHSARQPAILDLITLLREHSAHEEQTLYPLGDESAPAHVQDKIAAALKAAKQLAASLSARVGDTLKSPTRDRARPE